MKLTSIQRKQLTAVVSTTYQGVRGTIVDEMARRASGLLAKLVKENTDIKAQVAVLYDVDTKIDAENERHEAKIEELKTRRRVAGDILAKLGITASVQTRTDSCNVSMRQNLYHHGVGAQHQTILPNGERELVVRATQCGNMLAGTFLTRGLADLIDAENSLDELRGKAETSVALSETNGEIEEILDRMRGLAQR